MTISSSSKNELLPKWVSPFTIVTIFVVVTLCGVLLAPMLPFRLYPNPGKGSLYVNFSYYEATAEAVELEVTSVLEGRLSLIEGVEGVSSVSGDGWGQVTLNLGKGIGADAARFQALSLIREVYPRLPIGVSYPRISSYSVDAEQNVQLLAYSVSGDYSLPELQSIISKQLTPVLSAVDGVSAVEISGANPLAWFVEYNTVALQRLGLTVDDIEQALERASYNQGVGFAASEQSSLPISVVGQGVDTQSWLTLPIAKVGGRMVTLGDVATVAKRETDPEGFFRVNGESAVTLVVSAASNANQIKVADRVYASLQQAKPTLPSGINLVKSFDNTTFLREALQKNVLRTLFSIAILLLFVLVANRSWRYLLIVLISLVSNLAIAVIFFLWLDLEIHLYSLSGITLSLGLIIDNTLVMVDHLRHRRNLLVFTAVLAATLTTIGALTSIFFLNEEQRINLMDFAWVIIVNLGVSLLIALLLIPSLSAHLGLLKSIRKKSFKQLRRKAWVAAVSGKVTQFIYRFRRWVILVGVLSIGTPIFLLPDTIESSSQWAKIYNTTLGSSFYKNSIKPVADRVLGGTLRTFYNSAWKKQFWGTPERTRVVARMSLPDGTTLHQTNALMRLFEAQALSFDGVEMIKANVSKLDATLEVFFTTRGERSGLPFHVKAGLESLAITQAGADFSIYGVGQGFSNRTDIGFANSRILLTGYSYRQLMAYAKQFADSLRSMPRVDKVWIKGGEPWMFTDQYRRYLSVNQEQLALLNVGPYSLASQLMRFSPRGDITSWVSVDGEVSAVHLRQQGDVPDAFVVKNAPLEVDKNQIRPLTIGHWHSEMVGERIYKWDQQYVITLAYDYIGPSKLVDMVLEKQIKQIQSILPVGFSAKNPSDSYRWNKEEKTQYLLIGLMVLIIFIVTATLLESLLQPLAVILLVPISFVGVFITYSIFDLSFDQGTYAAFLLLGGLVVNSAIYIINEQNNLAKRYPNATAISIYTRALSAKLVPVLLTVISTVLGLLPFVMFGEEPFWFSLAAGTIGGLLFSIPALLLFLPALPGGVRAKSSILLNKKTGE